MTLAKCLATAPDLLAGLTPGPPIPSTWDRPPYPVDIDPQEHRWWCWAAVAQAMAEAYEVPLTQPVIAKLVKPNVCPPPPTPDEYLCYQTADLAGVLEVEEIKTELLAVHPCTQVALDELALQLRREAVPCSFALKDTIHYCLIIGMGRVIASGVIILEVLDPWCATLEDYPVAGDDSCHVHPVLRLELDSLFFLE